MKTGLGGRWRVILWMGGRARRHLLRERLILHLRALWNRLSKTPQTPRAKNERTLLKRTREACEGDAAEEEE